VTFADPTATATRGQMRIHSFSGRLPTARARLGGSTLRLRAVAIASAALVTLSLTIAVPARAAAESITASEVPSPLRVAAEAAPFSVVTPFASGTTRLYGASRIETAIATSKRYQPNVPVAFVATAGNFPDALSAAAAAAALGGPLLLTPPAALPSNVLAEIKRLQPARIFVVGGTGVVSENVAKTLRGVAPTQRLGGADRYSTGLAIVRAAFSSSAHAIIATGRSFPDALAATGAAGTTAAPVILVDGARPSIPSATMQALARLGVTSVGIAGGTGVVPIGFEAQLRKAGYEVTRYGGSDRYDTAAIVNRAYFPSGASTVFLATGVNFPDALAGAALAGRLGAPMFITTPGCTPGVIREAVADLGAAARVVMGGPSVVSDVAAQNLGCLTASTPGISGSAIVGRTLTASEGKWSSGTSFSYQWFANGTAVSGATGRSFAVTTAHVNKRISVRVTGTKPGYVTVSRTSAATAAVPYPSRTSPAGSYTCPAWAPIKGNASSMIYHVPGGQFYEVTNPEECFRTEAAAVAAGYRKSKR